jgi:hypothetical protein
LVPAHRREGTGGSATPVRRRSDEIKVVPACPRASPKCDSSLGPAHGEVGVVRWPAQEERRWPKQGTGGGRLTGGKRQRRKGRTDVTGCPFIGTHPRDKVAGRDSGWLTGAGGRHRGGRQWRSARGRLG